MIQRGYILKGSPKYFEAIEKKVLGENTLDFIALNTPPVCNYGCIKCSTGAGSKKPKKTLSLEEVKDILSEARDLGALALTISGEGEPLMHEPFLNILEHAHSLGLVSVIATNGSLLNKDKIQFFYDNNVTLTVSLDTLKKDKYIEQCRVKGKFDSVLENISIISEIYGKSIENQNKFKIYRSGIHTILNSENLEEISALKDFCNDKLFFSTGYIAEQGKAFEHPNLFNNYKKIKSEAEKQGEAFLLCDSKKGFPVCGFFYYGLTIGYNGEVLLADHALETEGLIGNIRNQSLKELKQKSSELIDSFYNTEGSCYCIVRDPFLNEFCNDKK